MNAVNVKNTEYDEDGNVISENNPDSTERNTNLKKKYCNINKKISTNTMKESLSDEPGIPELMNLYYDKYDYEKGEYNNMSDESSERFKNDLFLFYKHFSGIEEIIKKKYPDLNEKQLNEIFNDYNSFYKTKKIAYFNKTTNKIETIPYMTVEGGDNKYASIAAASILAKVERDKYIEDLCNNNPELSEFYGIDSNKGYGAKKHLDGIKEHAITIWHRRSF